MGKCASKQQLHHRHQQKYNWNDKSNGRAVSGQNTRSSVSEQSIFLLIENEVILFYQVVHCLHCPTILYVHSIFVCTEKT